MLEYDKIDISEGIGINKANKSKQRMFCRYWYFLNKNFNNGHIYNIMQILLLLILKKCIQN